MRQVLAASAGMLTGFLLLSTGSLAANAGKTGGTPNASVAACAAEAMSPFETGPVKQGVAYSDIDAAAAIKACEAAHAANPTSKEATTWLARAYIKADRSKEAVPLLETAVKAGDVFAKQLLGDLLATGDGVTVDMDRSNQLLGEAADAGFAPAQMSLGSAYEIGDGVTQDYVKALKYYTAAAAQGLLRASYKAGYLYQSGLGTDVDYKKAMQFYSDAAAFDDPDAIYAIGILYEYGEGATQDYAKAVEYFQRGSNLGEKQSQTELGYFYNLGLGVAQDYVKAAELYKKAADQGWALAQSNLGLLYVAGQGVTQDYAKAKELFEASDTQGNANGTIGLANLYIDGNGVDIDYAKGLELALKAAATGDAYSESIAGYLYAEGLGTARDWDTALSYFKSAADQGDQYSKDRIAETTAEKSCAAEAASQYEPDFTKIGKDFNSIDADKAIAACQEAVKLDDASYENKAWLARAYLKADKTADALPLLEVASTNHNAVAETLYGGMLQEGSAAVGKDPKKAVELFEDAASTGFAPAEFSMGLSYETGSGVDADVATAIGWYQKAADHGMQAGATKVAVLNAASSEPSAVSSEESSSASSEAPPSEQSSEPSMSAQSSGFGREPGGY